jgi:hypothetical protein
MDLNWEYQSGVANNGLIYKELLNEILFWNKFVGEKICLDGKNDHF